MGADTKRKIPGFHRGFVVFSLERAKRLELSTYCMASSRSSQLSYARALTEGWEYGLSGGLSRGEFWAGPIGRASLVQRLPRPMLLATYQESLV